MKHLIMFAAGVLAVTAASAQTTTVRYSDLDIASAAGHGTLMQRITRAADTVCSVSNGSTDLASHIDARNCQLKAVAAALASVALKGTSQYASR